MKPRITIATIVGLLVIIFGTIYVVVQQAQRNDANYPQIQLAEDQATQITRNNNPYVASAMAPVDMKSSLAPFVIVYDHSGKVVSGSGYLNGKVPKPPAGILSEAKGQAYNAVTWQPGNGVRIAAVTVTANNYYVLSGRSLTEVEKNESETFKLTFVGGMLSLLVLVAALVGRRVSGSGQSGSRPAKPAPPRVLKPMPAADKTDQPAPPVEPPLPPAPPEAGF